jgi:hypothetical protein
MMGLLSFWSFLALTIIMVFLVFLKFFRFGGLSIKGAGKKQGKTRKGAF